MAYIRNDSTYSLYCDEHVNYADSNKRCDEIMSKLTDTISTAFLESRGQRQFINVSADGILRNSFACIKFRRQPPFLEIEVPFPTDPELQLYVKPVAGYPRHRNYPCLITDDGINNTGIVVKILIDSYAQGLLYKMHKNIVSVLENQIESL